MEKSNKIGVVGAGSFGTSVSKLLAYNADVLLYTRQEETLMNINEKHEHLGYPLSPRIQATNNLKRITHECTVIFPVVPSSAFRSTIKEMGPFLRPYHILIHGTKGFSLKGIEMEDIGELDIDRSHVQTMSEVIKEESVVERIGCLSGPNLAVEILEGQPTATLISSRFDEVISTAKSLLKSEKFYIFGSYDMLGAELAGALKNVVAIGSGLLKGKGLGKNMQGMLISRGLIEMIYFGREMGSSFEAFLGTAGIGDLVTTATSKKSRNYSFGFRMGQGETYDEIVKSMPELAEGVRTLKITRHLARHYKLHVPITEMLYSIIFEGLDFDRAMDLLMRYKYDRDIDFL